MNSHRVITVSLFTIVLLLAAGQVFGDPLPGEIAKFAQLPLNGGLPVSTTGLVPVPIVGTPAPFPGHDELSTAWINPNTSPAFVGQYQADDFADKFNTPVVHVQWWGSYMNQSAAPGAVPAFDITFESDVPAVPGQVPSHPGSVLLSQIVLKGALAPTSGTFTETPLPVAAGNPDGNLFLYNAELKIPFTQLPDTVYWLKIVALDPAHLPNDPGRIQWGWHNRDWGLFDPLAAGPPVPSPGEFDEAAGTPIPGPVWHFQDDAVGGSVLIDPAALVPGAPASVIQTEFVPESYVLPYDGPPGEIPLSKDLAFVLYTVPEPSSLALLGLGGVVVVLRSLRRK